ncbi:MAG: YciI family protein, partial [Pseudomonadota bacterium]
DKPGALPIRLENRDAHLAYLAKSPVVFAGPFLDDAAETADGPPPMTGSLVVLDLPDRAAAEAWAADDPYAKAGLFSGVEIRAWKRAIG